jgi:hypothetical protein
LPYEELKQPTSLYVVTLSLLLAFRFYNVLD